MKISIAKTKSINEEIAYIDIRNPLVGRFF